MSIQSEIDRLATVKADLKAAINGASGSTVGDVFGDYPGAITSGKSAVAAAITDKGVTTVADATFQQMATNIGQIQTGPDTSDATATAGDILSGKTAYGASGKLTGTITSQNAVTITPGTTQQTAIPAGTYAAGAATVEGDANLIPRNIAEGVSIFGVTGTFTMVKQMTSFGINNSQTGTIYVSVCGNGSISMNRKISIRSGSRYAIYPYKNNYVSLFVSGVSTVSYLINGNPASEFDNYTHLQDGTNWSLDLLYVTDELKNATITVQ